MNSAIVRQVFVLIGLAFLPALGQAVYYRGHASWQQPTVAKDEVRIEEALAWGDSVLWGDARPTTDFEEEHIPGAVSLYQEQWNELLPQMLAAWAPDKRVIVYCSTQSCELSREVAKRLHDEAGLENVHVLHGGWEAWKEAKK